MKKNTEFQLPLKFLLTDIDDTLTYDGQLGPESYEALWLLHSAGVQVLPVTGRPAGWCEMIARFWPVCGVIGENGGFYFRYHQKKMQRYFFFNEEQQNSHRLKLQKIQEEVLAKIPGCQIASDQFCRLMDLAVDFCEDIPRLQDSEIQKIVKIFEAHGAQAKVSSIHVNGWFGDYDKLTMSLKFLDNEFGVSAEEAQKICGFVGDSPNDEPMFKYFPHSFGVANIKNFAQALIHPPTYVSKSNGGKGFAEIAAGLIQNLHKDKDANAR